MTVLATTALTAGKPLPAICTEWTMKRTPAQIQQCVKLGWQQPTTSAGHIGFASGHGGAPVLAIVIAAVIALWLASRMGRSRKPATN
jgi:hypothetical protein